MKRIFIFSLLLANTCFGQVNLNLGLRAYYPFTGNANDVSGNNNNPVFNNATLTADRFGNPNSAYHFNGTSSYMMIPNSPSLNTTNQISLVAWVRPMGFYAGNCHGNSIIMKGDADYLTGNQVLRFDDNAYTNGSNCGGGPPDITHQNFYGNNAFAPAPGYTPYIQVNQWYCVVVTLDGTTAKLYVNCELKASRPQGGQTFTNAYDLYLGKLNNASFPYWLNGDLDEVRIYDRALTVDEVNVLGGCQSLTPCNNWLNTPSVGSSVKIGDLDVSGTQITIEAEINRTVPWVGSYLYAGDIVSKHSLPSDVNYLLRPNSAEITTTNGYFVTPPICLIDLNKTYHVALVYDGTTLKFYRNGFLMSQVPATGNLFLNNWITTIGDYASGAPVGTNFQGYINEVRIWNVARTQAQLQTYMNASLPNPNTQTGLLAYYTFDDLTNKQGNTIYNGTLNGAATINNTNPNCTFTPDSCAVVVACNNWLRTQAVGQKVTVGDLDISGNQMTVEANFNCTSFPVSRPDKWEDIVSKHANTTDANYVLRMDLAAITTTTGHYLTPPPCDNLVTNKTYHVALVYDGTNLKLYRDGIVISQIACTGNLILNNWQTTIGDYAVNNPVGTNFLGYINEVRIWNVARTQAQLQAYMNTSLPNPTTQTGLQGYYTFNDLLNKQGNAAYNGTLNGGATINNTNPNCSFTPETGLVANAGADTTFCSNTTVSYVLHGSGSGTYSWSPAIYLNNPNIQNPTATISATTTFYLTVTGAGACSGMDTITLFVNPVPTVKTIADTLICSTNTVTLFTNGAQAYSWTPGLFLSNPNIANPVYSGNQSQTYYVTGTGANGCKATDTVNVSVNVPGGLLAPPDKTMCGQSSVQLDGFNGNTVSYLWSPASWLSSTTIINPIATPPASTAYTVKISDPACNTDSTFTVRVIVGTALSITVGKSNDIDCANRSAVLHASGGDTYLWTPSTGLSDPTIPNPVATPTGTQKYVVLVTNSSSGCSNTGSVTVFSNVTASVARYMPNAFTPDGNGINDCYGLKNWMYIKKLEFRIFNRYGEQVFSTSDPGRCWDGTYKGKKADAGTYVFYIKAETNCGTEEQRGNFLLIR